MKSNKQVKAMLEPIYVNHIETRKSFKDLSQKKPFAMTSWLSYHYHVWDLGDDTYKGKCTVSIKANETK